MEEGDAKALSCDRPFQPTDFTHTHKSHYIISKAITEIPLGQKLLDIKLDLLYLPQKKLTYICNNVNDLVPTTG